MLHIPWHQRGRHQHRKTKKIANHRQQTREHRKGLSVALNMKVMQVVQASKNETKQNKKYQQ